MRYYNIHTLQHQYQPTALSKPAIFAPKMLSGSKQDSCPILFASYIFRTILKIQLSKDKDHNTQ